MTDILDTGHNIQIIAEGKCGDVGTIFRDAAGSDGPPSGADQDSTPASTQGELPTSVATDLPTSAATNLPADIPTDAKSAVPAGLLSSVLPRQAEALDLLKDNSAILGGGAAGETLEHFGTCWDGKVTNPSNPTRRDVAQLQSGSYIVLQWNQDNPGLWVSFLLLHTPQITLLTPSVALPLPHRMAPERRFRLERAREPRRAPKQFADPRADCGPVRELESLEQGPPGMNDYCYSTLPRLC